MLKKSVVINEDNNEIRYYEKDKKPDDYLDTICTEEDCYAFGYIDSDHISEDLGYEILKNSYFGRELIKYD